MDQHYKIRKAIVSDVEEVFAFISHLEERSFDFKAFSEKFKENTEKPDILYLVAVDKEDQAIGFISSHGQNPLRLDGRLYEVQEIYVSKSYRGKGIEKMLFTSLEESVSKLHCERMEVSAEMQRIDAKKFYGKLGFTEILARYIKIYSELV